MITLSAVWVLTWIGTFIANKIKDEELRIEPSECNQIGAITKLKLLD